MEDMYTIGLEPVPDEVEPVLSALRAAGLVAWPDVLGDTGRVVVSVAVLPASETDAPAHDVHLHDGRVRGILSAAGTSAEIVGSGRAPADHISRYANTQ